MDSDETQEPIKWSKYPERRTKSPKVGLGLKVTIKSSPCLYPSVYHHYMEESSLNSKPLLEILTLCIAVGDLRFMSQVIFF